MFAECSNCILQTVQDHAITCRCIQDIYDISIQLPWANMVILELNGNFVHLRLSTVCRMTDSTY